MIFYWNNVQALANYSGGYVTVVLEDGEHRDDEMSKETAIDIAVARFRSFLLEWRYVYPEVEDGQKYPAWFSDYDIEEYESKVKDFREELERIEPQVFIFSTAILIPGSD